MGWIFRSDLSNKELSHYISYPRMWPHVGSTVEEGGMETDRPLCKCSLRGDYKVSEHRDVVTGKGANKLIRAI